LNRIYGVKRKYRRLGREFESSSAEAVVCFGRLRQEVTCYEVKVSLEKGEFCETRDFSMQ
jgi:hypothetical protein